MHHAHNELAQCANLIYIYIGIGLLCINCASVYSVFWNRFVVQKMSGDSGGSRKQVFISLADKQGIIKKIESGKKLPNVASEYGISRSQVYKIYKLIDQITKKSVPKDCKIMKAKPRYKEIDEAVFEWVRFLHSHYGGRRPVPVSRALIKARAIYEAKARNISDFKASDGWFWRWRWRFNVGRSVALHGEAADVDLAEADKEVDRIRRAILDGKFNPI